MWEIILKATKEENHFWPYTIKKIFEDNTAQMRLILIKESIFSLYLRPAENQILI